MNDSRSRAGLRILSRAAVAAALLVLPPGLRAQAQPQLTLAEEMEAALPQLRAELPKQVDNVTAWTAIDAIGTEFLYEMSLNFEVPRAQLATLGQAMQAANQARLCADPNAGALIRRGASMRHLYTDQAGNRFETRVVSCPPASSH